MRVIDLMMTITGAMELGLLKGTETVLDGDDIQYELEKLDIFPTTNTVGLMFKERQKETPKEPSALLKEMIERIAEYGDAIEERVTTGRSGRLSAADQKIRATIATLENFIKERGQQ